MEKFCDQTSIKPKLLIYGKERYTTGFGTIMTILSYIAMIVLSGYFLISFYQKKELSVIFFRETKDYYSSFDLTDKFLFFSFKDTNGVPVDPRMAQVASTYWIMNNGTISSVTYMDTENCVMGKHIPDQYKDIFHFDVSGYQCISPGQYNLSLTALTSQGLLKFYNFYVTECKNTTANGNMCYSPEVIQSKLQTTSMFFEYYFPSYVYDHYNTTNPLSVKFMRQKYRIYVDFFYSFFEYYKELIYESDNGYVFEDPNTFKGHVFVDSVI
jgi:hypothetical protein